MAAIVAGVAAPVSAYLAQVPIGWQAEPVSFRLLDDGQLEEVVAQGDADARYRIELMRRPFGVGYALVPSEETSGPGDVMLADSVRITQVGRSVVASRGGRDAELVAMIRSADMQVLWGTVVLRTIGYVMPLVTLPFVLILVLRSRSSQAGQPGATA